jgi:hypothetical protein
LTGQRGEGLIIEDDYDAGFRYDRDRSGPSRASPPPPGVIDDGLLVAGTGHADLGVVQVAAGQHDQDKQGGRPLRRAGPIRGGDPDGVSMGVDHIRQARTEEYVN